MCNICKCMPTVVGSRLTQTLTSLWMSWFTMFTNGLMAHLSPWTHTHDTCDFTCSGNVASTEIVLSLKCQTKFYVSTTSLTEPAWNLQVEERGLEKGILVPCMLSWTFFNNSRHLTASGFMRSKSANFAQRAAKECYWHP